MARIVLGDRPPAYMSKARLAAELDLSESTIDDYVRRGILPKPIHLGGSVRWCWATVQASLSPLAGSAGSPSQDPFMSGLKNVSSAT